MNDAAGRMTNRWRGEASLIEWGPHEVRAGHPGEHASGAAYTVTSGEAT